MELFMFLWIIVLLPKTLQMVVLGAIVIVALWQCKGFRADQWTKVLFLYILLHIVSICVNLIVETHEISRILAAINMICIWCIAALYYIYFKNSEKISFLKFSKCCFVNVTVMLILLAIYAVVTQSTDGFTIVNRVLAYPESSPRFQGLLEYPTLVTVFVILQIVPACYYLIQKTHSYLLTGLLLLLSFLPIYFSNSRSGYVLYVLAILICCLILVYCKFGIRVITGGAMGVLLLCAACWRQIVAGVTTLADKLINMRSGSNSVRLIIYQTTFERTLESPIIGKGIKDICPVDYPYGSHCSYLGYFYKTGIIGLVLIMTVLLGLLVVMWTRKEKSLTHMFFLTFLTMIYGFCIFEDLDGANWLICVFFAQAGLMMNHGLLEELDRGKGKL